MCTELNTEAYELFKKKLIYSIMAIWINNSALSLITLIMKIIRYIKSKIASMKVEPEEKIEKRIVITNLST